ncbi:hypothetical protein [Burkholderia ambifaria]|uniref:hypothetical protein n=1 Tax=Burkholderia ambifaria TaxID=152480 RepID=UPI00158F309E|nr:hypothetical protein [Burkholderia ambifaria]
MGIIQCGGRWRHRVPVQERLRAAFLRAVDSGSGKSSEAATWLREHARYARIDKRTSPDCTAGSQSAHYSALFLLIAEPIKGRKIAAAEIDASGILGGYLDSR